jgi:hypothetical protein
VILGELPDRYMAPFPGLYNGTIIPGDGESSERRFFSIYQTVLTMASMQPHTEGATCDKKLVRGRPECHTQTARIDLVDRVLSVSYVFMFVCV